MCPEGKGHADRFEVDLAGKRPGALRQQASVLTSLEAGIQQL